MDKGENTNKAHSGETAEQKGEKHIDAPHIHRVEKEGNHHFSAGAEDEIA